MILIKGTKTVDEDRVIVSVVSPSHPHLSFRGGWSVGKNQKLADRLIKAIDAGVALQNVRVATDIYDQEYLTGDFKFYMRRLNSELNKMGF